MHVSYTELNYSYTIPIKNFTPDSGMVNGYTVACHGFGGNKESSAIQLLAERLTEKGVVVIAFDFPCHGESQYNSDFSVKECCNSFRTVLNYVYKTYNGADIRSVFATSFGGYITLLEQAFLPIDVKIVLRAPAVNMNETFIKGLLPVSVAEFMKNGAEMGFERKFHVDSGFWLELNQNDISQTNIDREMLIIHGNKDDLVLPRHIETFCSANPKAELKVIDGADHRFKEKDYLEQAIDAAVNWITNEKAEP